jgi:O-antigen/teichoic acid export membrane protein
VGVADVSQPDVLDSRRAGGLIVRGGAVRAAGYVAATLLSLLSFSLITRHLGVARFGDYQTVLSVITVVAAITDAGMATLAVREYATLQGATRDRLMRNLLGARLGLTAAGVVAAVAFALAAGFDGALVAGTALAGIGIGFNVVQSMLAVPLAAQLQLTTQTLLELGRQVVLVALLVLLVLLGAGVLPLLAATIPAGVAGVVATALLVRGRIPLRPALHADEWPRLLRLTVPVALTLATGTLYVYLAQVVTELVATESESGLFAAAFRVFLVVAAVPGLVVSAAFPLLSRAARDDQERLAYALDRLFATMAVCGGFVGLTLSIGAPVAIEVVAGAGFEDAVPALRLQAWALLASFLLAPAAFALLSLRLHKEIAIANLVALAVSATLTLLLAPDRGATGAAIATLAAETLLVLATFVLLVRVRPELRPHGGVVAKVAAALALGAGAAVLSGLPALPAAVLAALTYVAVVLATRAVPAELRELLPWR